MKRIISILFIFTLLLPLSLSTNCSKMPSSPKLVGEIQPGSNYMAVDSLFYEMDLEDANKLRVETVNGKIEVEQILTSRRIEVQVVKRVQSFSQEDAQASLTHIVIFLENESGEILVKTFQPATSNDRVYSVDYYIRLPKNVDVQLTNQNGQIIVREIHGNAYIHSESGAITGDISLPDGGVIDMQLTNGSIDLEIPVTTNAAFSAFTKNGDVQITGLILQHPVGSAQSLQGIFGDGSGAIGLSTTNGDIKLSSM